MPTFEPCRRTFLTAAACGTAAAVFGWPRRALVRVDLAKTPLRFGVITDVHKDIMHETPTRLSKFVRAMEREKSTSSCSSATSAFRRALTTGS